MIPTLRSLPVVLLACVVAAGAAAQPLRPNVLLIVADDLGYSDLGVYGGEIRTPNIDSLAANGVLFTRFHASPLCSTTRAMLLSGNNNHVAGLARQGTLPGPVIPGLAGYENELSDRVAVLPALLHGAGYRTYMAGKWHLGAREDNSPLAAGFERSFAMTIGGGASHFRSVGIRPGGSEYREDNRLVEWPDGGYSTEVYTDRLLAYLEADRDDPRPFFMLAAYTSPHWPLQVPDADLYLYSGRYADGYDVLREQRFASLRDAGIVPADWRLPPRNPAVRPFAELDPAAQHRESRKMELYAAMVDNLDRNVGRLLNYLRENDLYDDTLIVFMSDNGAAGEDFFYGGNPVLSEYIRAHYEDSTENMGRIGSFVSYGPPWAEAGSAPFRLYKGFPTQGGIVAPLIVTGPPVARRGEISDVYLTVMDWMPTLLEAAGARYPSGKVPMAGESALGFLRGAASRVHSPDYVTTFNYDQRSYVRQGDWKLMTLEQPFDERDFALYRLSDDPGETTDLSARYPERRAAMIALWRRERRRLGIVLPEDL